MCSLVGLTLNMCVPDCSLTEGAAFVLCAFHGAIWQHLEVEAMSAVEPRDDALQLWLCRANTGLNTRLVASNTDTCWCSYINAHTCLWTHTLTKQQAGLDIYTVGQSNSEVCVCVCASVILCDSNFQRDWWDVGVCKKKESFLDRFNWGRQAVHFVCLHIKHAEQ